MYWNIGSIWGYWWMMLSLTEKLGLRLFQFHASILKARSSLHGQITVGWIILWNKKLIFIKYNYENIDMHIMEKYCIDFNLGMRRKEKHSFRPSNIYEKLERGHKKTDVLKSISKANFLVLIWTKNRTEFLVIW